MTDDAPLARARRPTRLVGRRLPASSSVLSAAAIAWLGFLVHNVADLPNQTLLSPETLWPSLVTVALLVLYATGSVRVAGIGLFVWTLMNLAGGVSSVLPLSLLFFEPEQTVRHYSFHLLSAATQVPLLVVSYRLAVATPSAPAREAGRGT